MAAGVVVPGAARRRRWPGLGGAAGCLGVAALVWLGAFQACAPWRRGADAERGGALLAAGLVGSVTTGLPDSAVVWAGARDESGRLTPEARAVGEHLLSALADAPVRVARVDTAADDWGAGLGLPVAGCRAGEAGLLLGARLQTAGGWAYVRLLAVDCQTGNCRAIAADRLPGSTVERLVARTRSLQAAAAAEADRLEIELQLLLTRVEGALTRQLPLGEGGSLQAGDRLQARFSTSTDCDLYAFLYDSEGVVTEVFPSQYVYSGRLQYGSGQESWITLGETDRVYTLYVVAATRLTEDKTEWWDRLGELLEQGTVERFDGLTIQDRTLAELVGRQVGADSTFAVQRGDAAVGRGKPEEVTLADGTRLEVRPQLLTGRKAAIRAVSFRTE